MIARPEVSQPAAQLGLKLATRLPERREALGLAARHQNGIYPDDREFWTQRLGIVTPHRAQMSNVRNLLVETAEMPPDLPPFVDTVHRFQGQERDLMIASYTVADRDFVRAEETFISAPASYWRASCPTSSHGRGRWWRPRCLRPTARNAGLP
ncbi:MAG TPA: AAA domain-containing protein, partial [Roseiflexaceae bacterium]|nr:AAA domain-containing protein [Roseiflexaceae bacterium]